MTTTINTNFRKLKNLFFLIKPLLINLIKKEPGLTYIEYSTRLIKKLNASSVLVSQ